MNETKALGEEKIGKLLIKYSIPAILSMLITSLYNIADRAFIGAIPGVGSLAIAGLGITMPIFTLIVAFGVLTAMGATTNISIKLGEGKKDEAEKYLGNAFITSVIIAVTIMIIGLVFIDPILILFGASKDTLIYAKEYIGVIFIGSITTITGFTLNNSIRADGNPKMAANVMIAGCAINLVLDPIFIFIFDMGIRGAAIATVLTQFITFAWVIYYFTKGKSNMKLKKEYFKLEFSFIKKIIILGAAPFAMELSTSLVHVITNNSLKVYGGDLAIGAMTAVTSIALIFMMPVFGINQGAQTIIGYNYGAKKYDRSKKALKLAILGSTGIVTIGLILIQLFPEVFIGIFNKDPELMTIAVNGLRVYSLTLPLIGLAIVGPVYFQAIGKAKYSMFLGLLRQFILLIPIIFILPKFVGLSGVWIAQPLADIIASGVIIVFLLREFNKSNA